MRWLLRGVLLAVLLVMFNIGSYRVEAQTPEATEAATSQPLTLIWQSEEFTPDAALITPSDIAVDSEGNVYVSTQAAKRIKKFDKDGKFVAQWGDSGSGKGQLGLTAGLSVDTEGNVYVADFNGKRIEKYDSNGLFLSQWATEPPAGPASVVIDALGNAYVDNFFAHDHHVQKFDSSGELVKEWGPGGKGDGEFGGQPEDIALDADGNVYVSDKLNHRIQKFDPDGNFLAAFGGEDSKDGNGLFDAPLGLAIDADGNIYVVDVGSKLLQKLDARGNFIAQWSTDGGDLDEAAIVAVDADGNLYLFANADVTNAKGDTVNTVVLKKFQQS